MSLEGKIDTNIKDPREEKSTWLWLTNEGVLKASVGNIDVKGKENIKKIPRGAKIIAITSHKNDLEIPLAIHTLARDLDVIVASQSVHHKWRQGEANMKASLVIANEDRFKPVDYIRDESGNKSPTILNPKNFDPMIDDMEKGRALIIGANTPPDEALQSLEGVAGGYGGVLVATLLEGKGEDVYFLPVTSVLSRNEMDGYNVGTTLKEGRKSASVAVGEPFRLEKIEGIERFPELVKKMRASYEPGKERLTEEEKGEFKRLADALRDRSKKVMNILSKQQSTQEQVS